MQAVDVELQDDQPPEIQPLGHQSSITESTNFEVALVFANADGVTNISTDQTNSGNVSGRYSRTPLTRTLEGNEKLFELAGVRVSELVLNFVY